MRDLPPHISVFSLLSGEKHHTFPLWFIRRTPMLDRIVLMDMSALRELPCTVKDRSV